MNHRVKRNKFRQTVDKQDSRREVRAAADNITDMLDKQAVENFELNLQVNKYKSELRHALEQLEEHSYCPGEVDIQCDANRSKGTCTHQELDACNEQCQPQPQVKQQEVQHGDDCHCSKCCPNPSPNFFQRHKIGLLIGLIWIIMVFLAIGWMPTGGIADAINNSWVELIVNFFKMALFAIAGIATYNLVKKANE